MFIFLTIGKKLNCSFLAGLLFSFLTHLSLSAQAEITLIPARKTPLPLVSCAELEPLTLDIIRLRYPAGFRVFSNNITPQLKKKIQRLASENYPVRWVQPDNYQLRKITQFVILSDGMQAFLTKALDAHSGCSAFIRKDILEYGTRYQNRQMARSLSALSNISTISYERLLQTHHWWINLGFESDQEVPDSIWQWIDRKARESQPMIAHGLMECSVKLSPSQLELFSKLVALNYLDNTVRGIFYSKQGSRLTRFRSLAVNTLNSKASILD
ncbi:hypothetical protein EOPP23_07595 [Endozoicomonas sp. OPT23]|uniref:hypothetical protein n=1 Tax=Endozoicomonas sp. OPT23 TaxID=2072845 RepID=UPI00129B3393|nr:hypothetical protein [Endozoicomonas sp. OPT23]MRI32847.1 hypothetical protein [Endozoicomonas sp. OPT23]